MDMRYKDEQNMDWGEGTDEQKPKREKGGFGHIFVFKGQ